MYLQLAHAAFFSVQCGHVTQMCFLPVKQHEFLYIKNLALVHTFLVIRVEIQGSLTSGMH